MVNPTDANIGKADVNPEESAKLRGEALVAKVRELIHEGSVRRIVVKNDDGHTVMEIPVLGGVIAAVAAPIVIAVGAIAALANSWTVEVHRVPSGDTDHQESR